MSLADYFHVASSQRLVGSLVEADSTHGAHGVVLAAPVREVAVIAPLQDVMRTPVVWLLVHHPPSKQAGALSLNLPLEDRNLGFF